MWEKAQTCDEMTNVTEISSTSLIHEEAASWILRIEAGNLSEAEISELKAWSAKSALHMCVLKDTAIVWDKMEVMKDLAVLFPLQDSVRSSVPAYRQGFVYLASVLIVIFVIGNPLVWNKSGEHWINEVQVSYETQIGDLERIHLPDGSAVTLNTSTRIRAVISDQVRRIEMQQGEAFFDVIPIRDIPFIVITGGAEIMAVGTSFNVKHLDGNIEIIVTEGRVQITDIFTSRTDADPAVMLSEGERLRIRALPGATHDIYEVEDMPTEDLATTMMWKQRMLAFNGESLQEAVKEFSRYTRYKIEIADRETSEIRVGGYFRSDDLESMLFSFRENFDISITKTGTDTYLLKKNQQKAAK